jgi:hypothetical protein
MEIRIPLCLHWQIVSVEVSGPKPSHVWLMQYAWNKILAWLYDSDRLSVTKVS